MQYIFSNLQKNSDWLYISLLKELEIKIEQSFKTIKIWSLKNPTLVNAIYEYVPSQQEPFTFQHKLKLQLQFTWRM